MFLEVGDRFAEQFKLNKAIEEYQKAVELDKDNIDAQRRIIAAMRQKLYLEIAPYTKVNDVLSRIYKLHALNPHLENDIELLLEEARIQIYDDSWYDALNILEKAHKAAPGEPELLALLGLVRALTSPKDDDIFFRFFRDDSALTSSLDMPLKKRALIYDYLIREYEKLPSHSWDL